MTADKPRQRASVGEDSPELVEADALPSEDSDVELTVPERPQDEHQDGLEDLLPIAASVFSVWNQGAEIDWAEYAWAGLGRAGLTTYRTEVERALVVCRLLALSLLYREFCVRAFEEGSAGDWPIDEGDVIGQYPRLAPFVLGQLAERQGIDADIEVGWTFEEGSPMSYALRELVRSEYRKVSRALADDWGAVGIFSSLWTSPGQDTHYPLAVDVIREVVNSDLTESKMEAWQWVEQGMYLA